MMMMMIAVVVTEQKMTAVARLKKCAQSDDGTCVNRIDCRGAPKDPLRIVLTDESTVRLQRVR